MHIAAHRSVSNHGARIEIIDNSSMNKPTKADSSDKPQRQMKGFAVMTNAEVKRIATMGGKTISKNRSHMRRIGAAGGAARYAAQLAKNNQTK